MDWFFTLCDACKIPMQYLCDESILTKEPIELSSIALPKLNYI
jgi:hypothetical protein